MDIFKFINPNNSMKMEQGEIINGLTSKTWIERYAEAGEFTFSAPISSGMRNILPIGTYVSHVNSTDLMVVENHEINEDISGDGGIIITGRGFETILEQRIVGSNKTFPVTSGVQDYTVPSEAIWVQVANLIRHHILTNFLIDDNNEIPFVEVTNLGSGTSTAIERTINQKDLYSAVLELLNEGNLGIRSVRPGIWNPAGNDTNTGLIIHVGTDRRQSVTFSHDTGEIDSADYFWSNRKDKNCALITGRWVETTVIGTAVKADRRWMIVDASDVDQRFTTEPGGGTLSYIVNKMQQRGRTALAKQKNIALTKAEVSKQSVRALYRTDYDLGDLVSVEGNYNEESVQRVTEYVEIEDETGRSSYPTLTLPE